MAFHIRVACIEDQMAVSALLFKSYSVLMQEAYDAETLEKALPEITRAQPDLLSSGSYYVAETGKGRIVGAGGWTRTSPTGRNETATNGNIRHFGTDPEYTRRGIGKALIDRCADQARRAFLTELNCYSTLNGEEFYRACGFVPVEPYLINLPGDLKLPAIRMIRTL